MGADCSALKAFAFSHRLPERWAFGVNVSHRAYLFADGSAGQGSGALSRVPKPTWILLINNSSSNNPLLGFHNREW